MAMPETKITPNNLPQDCRQQFASRSSNREKQPNNHEDGKVEYGALTLSLLWNCFFTSHLQEVQGFLEFSAKFRAITSSCVCPPQTLVTDAALY